MNPNQHVVRLAIAALGVCSAGTALAQEPNPYYVGISQAFTHESNVFRVASGLPETSDTYSTTSLLAGINQPFSRQRFYADLAARYNRYRNSTQLDNTGYGAVIGLDWETIENLSGRLSYTLNDSLARYGADEGPALTTKNMEKSQEFLARAQYGSLGLFGLEGVFTHQALDYSAPEFVFAEYKQDAFRLGLLYRPSGLLTLGVAARYTKGKYPFAIETAPGIFQEDTFRRNDVDFTAIWVPSGQSTVRARLSSTNEPHDVVTSRNVSGATGDVSWEYKPTGKLVFTTALIRDTGAQSSFYGQGQPGGGAVGNNSQLSTSVLFHGLYEATAKIQLEVNARYVERDLVNTFGLPTGGASTLAGSDRLGELKLGVNYAPARSVLLGCSYGYEKRGASSTVSYPYNANVTRCSGQLKLQ